MPDTFWPARLAEAEAWVIGDTADARRALLESARYYLERTTRYERWGPLAQEDALRAADLLRQAGLPALAADCEDEFGIDAAGVMRALDGENGR